MSRLDTIVLDQSCVEDILHREQTMHPLPRVFSVSPTFPAGGNWKVPATEVGNTDLVQFYRA